MAGKPGHNAAEYLTRKKAGLVILGQTWAGKMEGQAKAGAPWNDRTGNARIGLHGGVEIINNDYFRIFLAHSMEYGAVLEEGSKPHVIRAKNKKALFWPGAAHPVRQVNHPGTRPYPIIKPTIDRNYPQIKRTILDYWG